MSGEVSVTWDDADNNLVISTGDTFDVVSEYCDFADTGRLVQWVNVGHKPGCYRRPIQPDRALGLGIDR